MRARIVSLGVLVCTLWAANAWGAFFRDDFNRANGDVGRGWTAQTDGTITAQIVNNEVLIAGKQATDWVRCGISRRISNETRIAFDFKADNAFNVHVRFDAAASDAYIEVYAWAGGPFSYASSTDGSWPGWVAISGSDMLAGQYNTLVLEQNGTVFTVTLNGTVVGTVTNANFTTIESVLISSDAAAGTVGSLHLDNVQIGVLVPGKARDPSPADGDADVPRDVTLGWTPGEYASTHDVYWGVAYDEVNNASTANPASLLVAHGQTAAACTPAGPLDFGQTYYWRVDEVNALPDRTVYRGDVWSLTTEPYAYAVRPIKAAASSSQASTMGPEKTIDSSGLDASDQHSTSATDMWLSKKGQSPIWIQYEFDSVVKLHQMWVWNFNQEVESIAGFGALDVTIETSTDGAAWTTLDDVPGFEDGTGEPNYVHNTTVDFGGALAKYVRLTISMNWASGTKQAGLSEVRFFCSPVRARAPQPAVGALGVALDSVLSWRPGREAAKHHLLLSTDANAVAGGTAPVKTLTSHSLDLSPLGLLYGKTYYWRVDEVNDAAPTTLWPGDVWSFTTTGYAVIDDFEAYDDACNRVFFAWVDGLGYSASPDCGLAASGGNATGSTVGNVSAPFAEKTIVHGGSQSMPMAFDNTNSPHYSETQREWSTAQAWIGGGVDALVVNVRGEAAGFLETASGTLIMNGTGTDIWNNSDEFRFVYKSLKGNGSITARIDAVANTDGWAKVGVMIRETLAGGSAHGIMAMTPSNGASFQRRVLTGDASSNTDLTGVATPYWVKLTRTGTTLAAQTSADGVAWVDLTVTPALTFTMANDVYIGLAVCSHVAGTVCGAKFSHVSTSGGVSGSWQVAEIGTTQVSGNAPETFYVALEDSTGTTKVVSDPDPTVIATGFWEQWTIPLSQFTSAGVNLGSVKKMTAGVGDRVSRKIGGAGKVYIDDIRLQP